MLSERKQLNCTSLFHYRDLNLFFAYLHLLEFYIPGLVFMAHSQEATIHDAMEASLATTRRTQ